MLFPSMMLQWLLHPDQAGLFCVPFGPFADWLIVSHKLNKLNLCPANVFRGRAHLWAKNLAFVVESKELRLCC